VVFDQNGNMQLLSHEGLHLAHGAEMYMAHGGGGDDTGVSCRVASAGALRLVCVCVWGGAARAWVVALCVVACLAGVPLSCTDSMHTRVCVCGWVCVGVSTTLHAPHRRLHAPPGGGAAQAGLPGAGGRQALGAAGDHPLHAGPAARAGRRGARRDVRRGAGRAVRRALCARVLC
jgi:hypothetical protein